jgi:hypothetical protein
MNRWIKELFRHPRRPAARPSFRPMLLALEERIVPDTVTVTNTNDAGAGSLRAAVASANPGDTIGFAAGLAGSTITLTTGQIKVSQANLTIDGGANNVTISGGNNSRIFEAAGNNDWINNLNLTKGLVSGANGGAILVDSGVTLNLKTDIFTKNSAVAAANAGGNGGAIENDGTLTADGCTFTSNAADANLGDGGAIRSKNGGAGQLTVKNSTFTQNTAVFGGAITTYDTTTLTNDTFGSNSAANSGGAVYAWATTPGTTSLTVTGSTFTGNTVTNNFGGGIETNDILDVETSTFTSNTAPSGWGGAIDYAPNSSANSSMTLNQDTFTSNSAASSGGAVNSSATYYNSGSVVVSVTNSTFSGNNATSSGAEGGGLYISQTTTGTATATATLVNDTFFQNTSKGHGGGLWLQLSNTGTGANTAALYSNTVYMNTASTDSGGVYVSAPNATVTLDNNIFDGNSVTAGGYTGALDIVFSNLNVIKLEQYNLVGTSDQGFDPRNNHDIVNNNPGLAGTLAANGAKPGYPQTLALGPASPGYEKGDPGLAGDPSPYGIDERGLTRQTGKVSIGAEDPDAK